jgi:hypothetical protein
MVGEGKMSTNDHVRSQSGHFGCGGFVEMADHRPRHPSTDHLNQGGIDSGTKESQHCNAGPKGAGTHVSRVDPDGFA